MSMQGASGPESRYLGYGASMAALTSLQHLIGLPGREPIGTGTNYPDHIPNPCHAAFAIVAALIHRRRTGEGQFIDIAQTEPTLALLGPVMLDQTANGRTQTRKGNAHECYAPHGVYPCAGEDRWIAISVETDAQWQSLVDVLGQPPALVDVRWAGQLARLHDRDALDAAVAAATQARDSEALMHELQARGVAAGVVRDAPGVLHADEQLAHRRHWLRLEHPEMGYTVYNSEPFRFSRSALGPLRASPLLGQHTLEVCTTILGMPAAEVEALQAQGVLA